MEYLVEEDGALVEEHFLRLLAESSFLRNAKGRRASPDLVVWVSLLRRPDLVARVMPVPMAIAAGVAEMRLEHYGRQAEFEDRNAMEKLADLVDRPLADLWRDLALLSVERSAVEALGLRARVERLASKQPELWVRSLPWILAVGSELDGLDVGVTLALAEQDQNVATALSEAVQSPVRSVRRRAEGVKALAEGTGPIEERLLDALGSSLDARRSCFPRPLEAPSATWLASRDLEDLLRGAVRSAARDFTGLVARGGAGDEETLTARLLEKLTQGVGQQTAAHRRLISSTPELSLGSRQETKFAEKGSGADVGILLKVSLPGREVIEVADLVQVKKANSLIPSASGGEAWQINRLQLDQLLRVSPTAVYWLIAGSGDVMAVPAKVLLVTGLMKTGGSARFTVGHSDIRHAAVGLEHYFTDLITGLWLGSTSDETVAAAKGLDPRNRPEFFLTIDVMFTQQRDELRG
ncbi:hypothetical protein [Kitasatospora sp. GP30]|uniref:hypothetical protein n=1 Tax=Kitasatospora sp. GP30 TaxID=3035084 RepID=UPI000C705B58|nr:hypothetical protein [Kitasatospora sp. GP30]